MQLAIYDAPWKTWRLGRAFGQIQARIHRLPAPPDVIRGERAWIKRAAPGTAFATLPRQQVSNEPVQIHLDYHPLNVLVQDGAISGAPDWTNAIGDDSRADSGLATGRAHRPRSPEA